MCLSVSTYSTYIIITGNADPQLQRSKGSIASATAKLHRALNAFPFPRVAASIRPACIPYVNSLFSNNLYIDVWCVHNPKLVTASCNAPICNLLSKRMKIICNLVLDGCFLIFYFCLFIWLQFIALWHILFFLIANTVSLSRQWTKQCMGFNFIDIKVHITNCHLNF